MPDPAGTIEFWPAEGAALGVYVPADPAVGLDCSVFISAVADVLAREMVPSRVHPKVTIATSRMYSFDIVMLHLSRGSGRPL